MATYDEKRECKSMTVEQNNEPVLNLLGQSYDLTQKAMSFAMQINANFFGKQEKERNSENPCCMRDAIVQQVDALKALCEELNDILSGLGGKSYVGLHKPRSGSSNRRLCHRCISV